VTQSAVTAHPDNRNVGTPITAAISTLKTMPAGIPTSGDSAKCAYAPIAAEALEAEVGRKLFDRHSNGVTLTFDGQQFLQRARAIEVSVSDAMRGPHRGEPRLMAPSTLPSAIPSPDTSCRHFCRLLASLSGITVRLHEFERDAIEHSLRSGIVDVAVMLVSNLHDRCSIRSRLLLRSPRRLWACANHPLLHVRKSDSTRSRYHSSSAIFFRLFCWPAHLRRP
jgi:DNA-binding transcriptional LysR family regulator